MAESLRLALLGKPEVLYDDAPVADFRTAKAQALLFYLAATGERHSRAARQSRPIHLPAEGSPFIGRERELHELLDLLDDPDCRLITITSLGGMGKTRLAQLANSTHMLRFINGVYFVPLAGVDAPSRFAGAVAAALGAPPAGQRDPMAALLDYLHNKELLLVLDNFEHLLEGADQVAQILTRCPDVKLVVTSREPLNLSAEHRFDLEGLDFAEANGRPLESYGAVQLLLQAAQQVQPEFRLTPETAAAVQRLCRHVAGMPLALKLAATWLRAMPIERIVAELEHNLDLLSTKLRDLPGPTDAEALALFDQFIPMLGRYYEGRALYRLGQELFEGAIAAIDRAGSRADASPLQPALQRLLIRLQVRVLRFYFSLGEYAKTEAVGAAALEGARALDLRQEAAWALSGLASGDFRRGRYAEAEARIQESEALFRALGDHFGLARVLNTRGNIAMNVGDYPRARAIFREVVDLYGVMGFDSGKAMARDRRYNRELLAEIQEELPPAMVAAAEQWSRERSLAELLAWLEMEAHLAVRPPHR